MPGSVTKVCVKAGDTVKKGDTLLTFEAMKMEQEIKSPVDGVVASVNVTQGASMSQGDLLVSIN
jgi:biotin carboxyl carrier protein